MPKFRADWVLPVASPPIRGGTLTVEENIILHVGRDEADAHDLGSVALLPGLVNAHTHLELSLLHRQVPPSATFGQWVRTVLRSRAEWQEAGSQADVLAAARAAIEQIHETGTSLIGEVSNTLDTVPLLQASSLYAQVFCELIGFVESDPARRVAAARARLNAVPAVSHVRMSLAPHAPYSVSAALFGAIRADLDECPGAVSTVHLGESPEELEFLRYGGGDLKSLLAELGRWPTGWEAPGVSPVKYLVDLGFVDSRTLVVHGVHFDGDDLSKLSALGATLVSCPRSNVHVGVGAPPLEAFYAMDVAVAFGTDSLASVDDLNLFAELAEARRIAPRVPARRLLESATLVGARALGFGRELGSLEPGKRAAVIAVRVPEGVADVEEYLVHGIEAAAVSWLESGSR